MSTVAADGGGCTGPAGARNPPVAVEDPAPVDPAPVEVDPVPVDLPPVGARPPVGVPFGPPAQRDFSPARHLADLDEQGRRAVVRGLGEPGFRAAQVTRHYLTGLRVDPATWTDIPATARAGLAAALTPALLHPLRRQTADRGTTVKTLGRLGGGALVESVLMRYPRRSTVCVSSQAGCALNCPFCATGQAGLTRNLSAGEIVEQVLVAARELADGDLPGGPGRLDNVVFMGMGEPLANYRAVVNAVRSLTRPAPGGLGLSRRHVTVSTVGLVPAIDKLAVEDLGVTLALSLHAPDDELRDELVPVNTRWKVAEALDAAHRYYEATGRRVSIEYALIKDVNDQPWRADSLAAQCNRRGRGWVHVNPIPLNPTPGSRWTASEPEVQDEFVRRLAAAGIAVTIRDTRGREIDGACGQLAAIS